MKLTKYGHACFTVEKDGKLLVIDPGAFTTDLGTPENVVGIVVTHEHSDHFDPDALATLYGHNPDSVLVAHHTITEKMIDHASHPVLAGDTVEIGPFNLKFYGGEHAIIHPSTTPLANLGVLINDTIYYPGDSFSIPNMAVEVLALPVSAPWCKISEVMDYLTTVKPKIAFPTHDAILSDMGKSIVDTMLVPTAEKVGSSYRRLKAPLET